MNNIEVNKNRVDENTEIGSHLLSTYIRLITLDYSPKNNTEMAQLIREHFGYNCTVKEIDDHERLYLYNNEDYEKLSRMVEFNNIEHYIE